MQNLLELEARGWRTLSTRRDAARKFYDGLLVDEVAMAFPRGHADRRRRSDCLARYRQRSCDKPPQSLVTIGRYATPKGAGS
jgi:hypothetical protein